MNTLTIIFACIGAITLLLISILLVLDLIDRHRSKIQNKERSKSAVLSTKKKEEDQQTASTLWPLYPFRLVRCARANNTWYEIERYDAYSGTWWTISIDNDADAALKLPSETTCKAKIQEILEEGKPITRLPLP